MRRILGVIVGVIWLVVVLPDTVAQQPAFAEATIDEAQPYVGQAIVYTLRTYTLDAIDNSSVIEPSLIGFGRAQTIIPPSASAETRNGTRYTMTEQQYVLYPLRVGILTIEPFRVGLPETPFQEERTLITEAITVDVQALPDNAPDDFRNAVGQFTMSATVDRQTLAGGDPLMLSLTIAGTGNLERLLPPELTIPEEWRLFATSSQFTRDNPRIGKRVFDYTIFPTGTGTIEVPSLSFSAFNPLIADYETQRTQPITLTITEGVTPITTPIIITESSANPSFTLTLLPIADTSQRAWPAWWFWLLWLLPPLLTSVLWMTARTGTVVYSTSRPRRRRTASDAFKRLRTDLKQASKSDTPKQAFTQIEVAITDYALTKTGDSDIQIALEKLDSQGVPIAACLHEAASGQYAPITQADVQRLIRRSLQAVAQIEEKRS